VPVSPSGDLRPRLASLTERSWLRQLALLLVSLLAWSTAIHGGYVNFDTPWLVVDNPILSSGSPSWLPAILWDMDRGTRLVLGAEYLPVRDCSVLLDFALFGPRFAWHHAHSLLWYLASCLLFLRIAERLLDHRWAAWLVATLFALHPLHVESVTWLASRKDVLGLFFFLLGVLIHLDARGRRWRSGAVTLCLILAVWSKNTAIVLPGLLVAISLLVHRERPSGLRWWLQWIPLGVATAALLAVSLSLGGQVSMFAPVRGGSMAAALLLEARVIVHYLGMVAWPVGLAAIYPEPPLLPLLHPASLGSLAVVLGMLAGIPLCARRWPLVSLGVAWFFLTLLPVSQLVPIQNLMADRYLLLPLGGLLLVLAEVLRAERARWPRLLALAACLPLGVLTSQQNRVWHDSQQLWSAALERSPDSARIRRSLAGVLEQQGREAEAEALLRDGIERYGEHPHLMAGLGLVALKGGRDDEAEALLSAAWRADDSERKAAANLMTLLLEQGRLEDALGLGRELTRVHPFYAKGWNNHGSVLLGLGQVDQARDAFDSAAQLDPFYATPRCNLALVALQLGQPSKGVIEAERCVELDPDNRRARDLLAALKGASGR
jgi:Tfp pilus assembly protein PilF